MLIVCPSCARRYSVDVERIGTEGRSVRCASCREAFFVPPPAQDDGEQAFAPENAQAGDGWQAAPGAGDEEPASAFVNDNGFLDQRRIPRGTAPGTRGSRRRGDGHKGGRWPRAGLVAGLFVAMGLAAGLVAERDAVVAAAPRLAVLYELAQLPANMRGLAFRNVTSEVVDEPGGKLLVVAGEIENVTGQTRPVPALSLTVKGSAGDTIYTWTSRAPRDELEPGEVQNFRARLASPPPDGQNVLVHFVKTGAAGALAATGQGP